MGGGQTDAGVLPMCSAARFFASLLLVGSRSTSPVAFQPAVRWSHAEMVKAPESYWSEVRGIGLESALENAC